MKKKMITASNRFNMNSTYKNNNNNNNNNNKNGNYRNNNKNMKTTSYNMNMNVNSFRQNVPLNRNQQMQQPNCVFFKPTFNNNISSRISISKQNSMNELIQQSLMQPGLLANPPAAVNPGLLLAPSPFLHSNLNNININNNNNTNNMPLISNIQTRKSYNNNKTHNNDNNNKHINTNMINNNNNFQVKLNKKQLNKTAPIPTTAVSTTHNYNTRFNANRSKFFKTMNGSKLMTANGGPINGKKKNTAPYNTTQYIMFDYNKRLTGDVDQSQNNELSSAEQQFSDDWNMAEMSSSPASEVFSDSHFIKMTTTDDQQGHESLVFRNSI
jgi:hypothetical protein